MKRRIHVASAEAGYTLIEMLVAAAIMIAVTGAVFALLNPSQGTYQAQPEVADVQQRMRVGSDALYKDLVMTSAGTYSGAAVGTLTSFFAPVLPYRTGFINADPAGTFKGDTISLMYIPNTASQTTISQPMPASSAEIKVNAQAGCPMKGASRDPLCGFEAGMTVLIFDDTGSWDTFTVTNTQSDAMHLQHRDQDFNKTYGTGSYIAQVSSHTYYLKTDITNNVYQLMHYDGYQTDLPVVDNVVGLSFEYYGDAQPPQLLKPVTANTGPWTTYGPKPPAMGVQATAWPAGENCLFMVSGATQVPRMPALSATQSVVRLDPSSLTDGPWCPDASYPNRYDADLLRVRKIRVTLRVQAGPASLRGPASSLFTRGGTSKDGSRWVPDQEVRFEVTPRNMNLGR